MIGFVVHIQVLRNSAWAVDENHWKYDNSRVYVLKGFAREQDALAYVLEEKFVCTPQLKEFPVRVQRWEEWLVELESYVEERKQFALDRATYIIFNKGD
tara:strand:+ start:542 stop:838 length:297 start_codon:yes stop_codon:yes gene_type:complete